MLAFLTHYLLFKFDDELLGSSSKFQRRPDLVQYVGVQPSLRDVLFLYSHLDSVIVLMK